MSTAAERLLALAGHGGTAASLLQAIGQGGTTAAALLAYSGLASGSAAEHLLVEREASEEARPPGGSTDDQDHANRVRAHYDFLEQLPARTHVEVRIADDVRGGRVIAIPLQMAVPEALVPPAMHDRVPALRVADVLDDPLILFALTVLIDETDD